MPLRAHAVFEAAPARLSGSSSKCGREERSCPSSPFRSPDSLPTSDGALVRFPL